MKNGVQVSVTDE